MGWIVESSSFSPWNDQGVAAVAKEMDTPSGIHGQAPNTSRRYGWPRCARGTNILKQVVPTVSD
jgi:hypothetical protein